MSLQPGHAETCRLCLAGTTPASPTSPVLMASQSDKHLKRVARPAVAAPAGIKFICIEGCRERLSEPLHPLSLWCSQWLLLIPSHASP